MKAMRLVLLMALTIIIGCASNMQGGMDMGVGQKRDVGDDIPTLLVVNQGIDVIRIYEGGRRIGTVYPGRSECILLRNHQTMRELSFGYLAGRASDRWYAAQTDFRQGQHWTWNINSNLHTFSEIDIYPTTKCDK